ncbi:MAG: polyprenyl synthetase family protein [Burkholderiaceae bacterium]|nr:polyprenyl synthetase family protein [Burkholderiaceae bacterium]MEB2350111.1 polyprenyl synthetase family protein [Burkholderiaceae bacterium]
MTCRAATAVSAANSLPFGHWLVSRGQRTEQALERVLPPATAHPVQLHEAMRYAVLGGGKRVRPLLVHAAGEALGAPAGALDCAACAVELVHAYSLVHDDLPCMDDDVLRRGRPTVHVRYGEALAMLVGDALQALAFEALAAAPGHGASTAASAAMVAELARAAGSAGMAGGQAIDLASVGAALGREALEDMHRRKTGALLRASVRLGALCAPHAAATTAEARAHRTQALDGYADAIGLAFQVVDDILDVEGDAATLGKTAGKDAQRSKPTYVSALGLEAARRLAGQLREQAHAAIAPLGEAARRLGDLADLIVLRKA